MELAGLRADNERLRDQDAGAFVGHDSVEAQQQHLARHRAVPPRDSVGQAEAQKFATSRKPKFLEGRADALAVCRQRLQELWRKPIRDDERLSEDRWR